jgi:membrane protein YdbS with pleckstrin-like domain
VIFPSKIDWWLIALVVLAGVYAIGITAYSAGLGSIELYITSAVFLAFPLLLIPIHYVIDGKFVRIRCGVIGWRIGSIPIDEIHSVRETRNPLSSPALSLDRLRIELTSGRVWRISPRDKSEFLTALTHVNSNLKRDGNSLSMTALKG